MAALALVAVTIMALPASGALAAGNSMRIEPADHSVDGGGTFTIYVVQNASVATTGAQFDLGFDPALVQVLDIRPSQTYASGLFLFGTVDDGSNASVAAAISKANGTGILKNIAAFLLPGSGTVPPGDAVVVAITMQAQPGPGGSSPFTLQRLSMIDEQGTELAVSSKNAAVTIAPGVGESVAPSAEAATSPLPSSEGGAASPVPAAGDPQAVVTLTPDRLEIGAGASATFDLDLQSGVAASSVVADVAFDPKVLQIVKIELGPDWSQASLLAGGSGQTQDQAITEANGTGSLKQVGAYLLPGLATAPTGDSVVVTVTVTGKTAGSSSLTVSGASVLDTRGDPIPVTRSEAEVAASTPDQGVDPLLIAGLVAVAVLLGAVAAIRTGLVPAKRLRRWPYAASLVLGLIPVVLFLGLVGMLVVDSIPVLTKPGLGTLLGDRFSSNFSLVAVKDQYGLLPAVWGTIEITFIAIALALPVSLAMAIIATEFPMGVVGRILRPILGVLAGVPPIVYAVAGVVLVTIFMAPKFAGSETFNKFDPAALGLAPEAWPPGGVPWSPTSFPWPPNNGGLPSSTLLGGVLIALLVIPFMSPLILDTMRSTPRAAREASFALGANRGYTLRRVVLPLAMPGIVAAVGLAALKALGDVLIIALVVGWQAETLPNPIVDVLERTSSLAAEGANMLGNLQAGSGQYCDPARATCAVGYTTALLLVVVAAAVVVGTTLIESRLRRRLAA